MEGKVGGGGGSRAGMTEEGTTLLKAVSWEIANSGLETILR